MSTIREISDAQFQSEVLDSKTPVLVDFYAPWCQPCKALGTSLETVAPEFADKVKIVKVNIDDAFKSAAQMRVRGVPLLNMMVDGQVVAAKSGAMNAQALRDFINAAIK